MNATEGYSIFYLLFMRIFHPQEFKRIMKRREEMDELASKFEAKRSAEQSAV